MNDLFDNNNIPFAGFRLQYLEVLNWGTFNEVRWQIEPNGSNALLTGDIGSGKSTLVDALTCLLVPHNKIVFNKAAGAEGKERNLLSYVKGEYKKEKEEITKVAKKIYLRPNDDTYTVIVANFKNQGYNEDVCLAQLFWTGKDSKVEKLLVISTTPLTIKEHFSGFEEINELRKRLRGTPGVQIFNDNFTQYSEMFRRLFGMNSDKAIDLFYQTVSMKSVSSLTDFVREQMLERTDVKEQVAALLKRFEDLKKAHEAVVHSREQYQILRPLTEACIEYGGVTSEIETIEHMLEIVPAWFAEQKWSMLHTAIEQALIDLEKLVQQEQIITEELNNLESRKQSILMDIANNGGKRIEQIGDEIKRHERDKTNKQKEFDDYERLALQAGLKTVQNEKDFEDNIQQAEELNKQCIELETSYRSKRDNLVSDLRKQQTEHDAELKELQSLMDRKTQIPAWLVGFRSQLCLDLRIEEEELPFMGELLKVKEDETEWEGAIEKLLHDAGISLLVPAAHYKSVSRYVNDNFLRSADGRGIKLTYLEADLYNMTRVSKDLDEDSIANKVEIKPDTVFYDWLENHLQRSFGDYICTDVDGLSKVPFGITRQGLIKSGRIRHIKDDRKRIDDRKNFVLGWTNTEKIKALEISINKSAVLLEQLNEEIGMVEASENKNRDQKQRLGVLLYVRDFTRIHWQYHATKIHELETERDGLLNNNDLLAQLERNKADVESQINSTKEKAKEITEKSGGLKTTINNHKEQLNNVTNTREQYPQHRKDKWFSVIDEKMAGINLTLKNIDNRQEEFRKQYQGENGELKKLRGR